MDNQDTKNLTDEEKMRLIQEAFDKYGSEVKRISKERDEKIANIIRSIDERLLEETRKNIKNI